MHVRDGVAQHARTPNFTGASPFEDTVPRCIAFDADRVQAGHGAFNGEIKAKRSTVVGMRGLPTLGSEEFTHRVRKSIPLG